MTTANYNKGLNINNDLITALYCRLSVEDIKDENGKKKRKRCNPSRGYTVPT